jgi:hypothetical protein
MPGALLVAVLNSIVLGVLLHTGRWKAVTVAVKIVKHSEGSPGSASSGGKRISAGREITVATNISHPNVVSSATPVDKAHGTATASCALSCASCTCIGKSRAVCDHQHAAVGSPCRRSLAACAKKKLRWTSLLVLVHCNVTLDAMSLLGCRMWLQVQTYHISTMTVAQRKALAAAWLEVGGAGASSSNSAAHMVAAAAEYQAFAMGEECDYSDSSNSSKGGDEEQSEALETWMVLEFCEKGSLQRALSQGRFRRRDSAQPDMVS